MYLDKPKRLIIWNGGNTNQEKKVLYNKDKTNIIATGKRDPVWQMEEMHLISIPVTVPATVPIPLPPSSLPFLPCSPCFLQKSNAC